MQADSKFKLKELERLIEAEINNKETRLPDDIVDFLISSISAYTQPSNDIRMSKTMAAEYLNMSTRQFDRYIVYGIIPKGKKQVGFKELSWMKSELDKAIVNSSLKRK